MIPAIPALISGKLALGIGAAGLVAVLGTGAWGTTMLIQRNLARAEAIALQAKLDREKLRASGFETSFNNCAAATREQNEAVARLADEGAKLAADLAAERLERAKEAKRSAQPNYQRAGELAELKPPPDANRCDWARNLVDQELQRERAR